MQKTVQYTNGIRLHTAINRVDFVQYLGACYILYVQR